MDPRQFNPRFNSSFSLPSGDKRQEAINCQIELLRRELIKELSNSLSKGRAKYLTYADLALSISNGASSEIPLALPGKMKNVSDFESRFRKQLDPDGTKSDCYVLSNSINPVAFMHFLEAARIDGNIPGNLDINTLKNSTFILEPKAVDEYHLMLSEAARFFSANPEIAQTQGAEYLALIYAQEELFHAPSFGLRHPVSFIESRTDQGILIKYPGISVSQRILPGSSIFIAGAGLNVLSNLNELRSLSEFNFELNDADPFVASCLANFFHLCPASNISVSHGKMSKVLAKRAEFDLIILSDIPNLHGDTPEDLVSLFKAACKPFTPVHIFQKDPEYREGFTKADTWEGWMSLTGYSIYANETVRLVAGPLEHLEHEQVLALSVKEITQAIEDYDSHKRTVPHRLLVANTPVD